jgi:hypothetical protein
MAEPLHNGCRPLSTKLQSMLTPAKVQLFYFPEWRIVRKSWTRHKCKSTICASITLLVLEQHLLMRLVIFIIFMHTSSEQNPIFHM